MTDVSRVTEKGNRILDSLAEATGAWAAVVRDVSSPVTWWQSAFAPTALVEIELDRLRQAGLGAVGSAALLRGAQIRHCSEEDPPCGLVYSFAGIYLLLVLFDSAFNRFQVEPQARRTLPLLERLIPLLPTYDDGQRASRDRRARARPRRKP